MCCVCVCVHLLLIGLHEYVLFVFSVIVEERGGGWRGLQRQEQSRQ